MGRLDEARAIVARLRAVTPAGRDPADLPFDARPRTASCILSGLHSADRRRDMSQTRRRLAAILAADVAGYSRLMGADGEGTLERLKALRAAVLPRSRRSPSTRAGLVKTTGDGLLVEFGARVVDCLRCAEFKRAWPSATAVSPPATRIEFASASASAASSSRTAYLW